MRTASGLAAALVAAALVAGCGGGAEPAPPAPPTASSAPSSAAAASDEQVCAAVPGIIAAAEGIDGAVAEGPVLPAGVALLLVAPRQAAASANVTDPELAAALAELVAAIDDLDAQARAALPEGGNAVENPVLVDADRLVAAAEAVQAECVDGG